MIEKAEKLQQEAEDMIGYKHYDAKNIGYFSDQFRSIIKKFSGRLDTRRKILDAVFSFYYLLTRVSYYLRLVNYRKSYPRKIKSNKIKKLECVFHNNDIKKAVMFSST